MDRRTGRPARGGLPSRAGAARGTGWIALALVLLLAHGGTGHASDVELKGQVRARQHVLLDQDFDSQSGSPDNYAILRATVSVRATASDRASAFIEFRDSRAFGEPRSTTTSLEQADAHQAYLQLDRVFNRALRLRVGRMEATYGRQRLIGNLDWDNVGRAFDGVDLRNDIAGFGWFDVFGFKTLETGGIPRGVNDGANAPGDREQAFGGAYLHYDTSPDGSVEAYALDLYDDVGELDPLPSTRGDERAARANRFTVGLRFEQDLRDHMLELYGEGAWQFGSAPDRVDTTGQTPAIVDGADVAAWAATAGINCAFGAPLNPWIGVEWNAASGDDGTDPQRQRTFDQLFPSSHPALGIMDMVGWRNIQSIKATLGIKPGEHWRVFASAHTFELMEPADSWYGADGAARLTGNGAFDSKLGDEVDVTLRYAPQRELAVEANWSTWLPGRWQEQALADRTGGDPAHPAALDAAHLATLMVTVSF